MRTENDLRLALAADDFVIDYQPVVDARTGAFSSVEALLRWRRMDGTVLLPEMFLGVAEETGLILQMDEWVLGKACLQNAAWQQAGLPRLPLSVNVSLARFDPARLLAQVDAALAAATLEPRWLEIEFRGEQLFALGEPARGLVADLRALGVKVAVDDVATSQASMAQLIDFGFDALKLDLAVVEALPEDERARRIAEAVCRTGSALGCQVIAKGVETDAHRELLARWGCTGLQGTLFSRRSPRRSRARCSRAMDRAPCPSGVVGSGRAVKWRTFRHQRPPCPHPFRSRRRRPSPSARRPDPVRRRRAAVHQLLPPGRLHQGAHRGVRARAVARRARRDGADPDQFADVRGRAAPDLPGHRIVTVFLDVGMDVRWDGATMSVEDMVNEGVRRAYLDPDNVLRASVLADPAGKRVNTRDNTPAVIHMKLVPGNTVHVTVAAKAAARRPRASSRCSTRPTPSSTGC